MATILAVDDKQDNLVVITAFLKNLLPECAVVTARSGAEALEKAKTCLPDAILLDIIMPEMDGYEVCRRLKSDETTKHIPVIMLTAVAKDIQNRIKGLDSGADAFMTKPIDGTELVAQVRVALRIKRAEDHLRKEKDLLEYLVVERTKALQESEKRFRSLVENSLIGIAIIQNEKVVYQNPEHVRIMGILSNSFDIRNFNSIYPDDREKLNAYYRDVLSGKKENEIINFRFFPLRSNGSEGDMKWVQCRANLFTYQDKDAILFCMVDVTRTKQLERLVNIEDKMSSLGRIAAGIAHEIRNPLSTVNIYLSILERTLDGVERIDPETLETINDSIDKMESASQKIESVIKRVLDFSRPHTPTLALTDMNQCVSNILEFSSAAIRKDNIEIKTIFQEDLPRCYMDTQSISQVILNLITNAVEAMKGQEDAKRITITTFKSNGYVALRISDNGPGIPDNIRDRLFDPFFTTKSNGSGIGLSISHRIVSDHDGLIDVGSGKSRGAVFTIKLPTDRD